MNIKAIRHFRWKDPSACELIVAVETDTGAVGWGSALLEGYEAVILHYLREFGNGLIGWNAFDMEKWMAHTVAPRLPYGGYALAAAASAIEIAVWDVIGRSLRLPLHKIIGGKIQQPLLLANPSQSYAIYQENRKSESVLNGLGVCLTGWDQGCRTVRDYADAARACVSQGFYALMVSGFSPQQEDKIRLRKIDFSETAEILQAVRSAVGEETELYLDCSGQLCFDQAVQLGKALSPLKIAAMVDPLGVRSLQADARLTRQCDLPIGIGRGGAIRQDYMHLFENQSCSWAAVHPGLCGGFHETRKILSVAEAHYVNVLISADRSLPALAAGTHAAVTISGNNRILLHDAALRTLSNRFDSSLMLRNGTLFLDDGVCGLGLTPHLENLVEIDCGPTLAPEWNPA